MKSFCYLLIIALFLPETVSAVTLIHNQVCYPVSGSCEQVSEGSWVCGQEQECIDMYVEIPDIEILLPDLIDLLPPDAPWSHSSDHQIQFDDFLASQTDLFNTYPALWEQEYSHFFSSALKDLDIGLDDSYWTTFNGGLSGGEFSSSGVSIPNLPILTKGDIESKVESSLGRNVDWNAGRDLDMMIAVMEKISESQRGALATMESQALESTTQMSESLKTQAQGSVAVMLGELSSLEGAGLSEASTSGSGASEDALGQAGVQSPDASVDAVVPTISDYTFVSPPSRARHKLENLYGRIQAARPQTPLQAQALVTSYQAMKWADRALSSGNHEEAELYSAVAVTFADIGLGVIPGVGLGKDIYEAVTGRSLITDEELGVVDRGLAIAGVATIGMSGSVLKGVRALAQVESFKPIGKNLREALAQAQVIKTDDLNEFARDLLKYDEFSNPFPPGKNASIVRIPKGHKDFVRVHGPHNQTGAWVMRKDNIVGLTPAEIKSKYALDYEPSHISEIEIRADLNFARGPIGENFSEQPHGNVVQYLIMFEKGMDFEEVVDYGKSIPIGEKVTRRLFNGF